jgi:hypothetical protein
MNIEKNYLIKIVQSIQIQPPKISALVYVANEAITHKMLTLWIKF